MNKTQILIIFSVLLNLKLIAFESNGEEYTEIYYDQETTPAIMFDLDDTVDTDSIKSHSDSTSFFDFESDCSYCNKSFDYNLIVEICVNNFRIALTFSPTIPNLWESDWVYNNGAMTHFICSTTPNAMITMSYYVYGGSSLKKIFTSTTRTGSVQSYIKLEQRNSPAYIECKTMNYNTRVLLILSKISKNVIKVNGLTLPGLCTYTRVIELERSFYEYYAVRNEPINVTLRQYSQDIHCNTIKYQLSNSNITSYSVSLIFENHSRSIIIHCYRKSNITKNQIDHYRMFEVLVHTYHDLFGNANMWVEGLKWNFFLEMYSTNHGLDIGNNDTSTTKVIKYLYNGEELDLTCYSYYEVANWAHSDQVTYKQINRVKCLNSTKGSLYMTTSKFVIKEFYSDVEISCISSGGNIFTVRFIREKSSVEDNVASITSSTNENSSVIQTITISVTILVAIIIVVFGFTVYKVVQVRNNRKIEQERIAAHIITYEPKYTENIYEYVKYENPKRDNQPPVVISKRPPIPLPCDKREDNQSSGDISQRPALPLPKEEEDTEPYKHYDTPYEHRLFRFGRINGPPNRSRTLKQTQ